MISHRVAKLNDYLSPAAAGWNGATHEQVAMSATPLAMQPTDYIRQSWAQKPYGRVDTLDVASVHDGTGWAVFLSWRGVSAAGGDFPDAVAVALPVGAESPLMTMGAPGAPLHILRWQSNREGSRSLLAGGIGHSGPGPALESNARALADGDTWRVVITRPLAAAPDAAVLAAGRKARIGFAVWQGGNDERAGIKAYSQDWRDLILDP